MKNKILFKETQSFTQWWLWLFLLLPFLFFFFAMLEPLLLGLQDSSGNISFSIILPKDSWIGMIIYAFVLIFFLLSKLKTEVTKDAISISHLLFVKKVLKCSDIVEAKLCIYGFVGYGIRLSSKYGSVYSAKGNKGLAITLKDGAKYLIGTQKGYDFTHTMKEILD